MNFKPSSNNPIQLRGSDGGWRWEIRRADQTSLSNSERFCLTVGRDLKVTDAAGEPRRVVIKTLKYPLIRNSVEHEAIVYEHRKSLDAQIELLNHISTPLLAQPLDYLKVRNHVDGLPESLKHNEPVIVLAWQPGNPIQNGITSGLFNKAREPSYANTKAIATFGRNIVAYLKLLEEHRIVCFDLNPAHILVAGNRVPRFLGVGSLCPLLSDGSVDTAHPNYYATSFGYAPPELSNPALGYGRRASTGTLGAFALGVILAQMATGMGRLPREWVPRGSFVYPQTMIEEIIQKRCGRSAKAVHHLIALLCAPDPAKRGTNLKSIDDILAVIAEDPDVTPEMTRIVQPMLMGADFQVEGVIVAIAEDGSGGIAFCEDDQIGEVFLSRSIIQKLHEKVRCANQPAVTLYLENTQSGLECRQVQPQQTHTNQNVQKKWHDWLIQQSGFSEGVVTYEDAERGFCNVFVDRPNRMLVHVPQKFVDQFSKRPVLEQIVLVRPLTGDRGLYSDRFVGDYMTTSERECELRRSFEAFEAEEAARRRKQKLETLPWIKGVVKWYNSGRGYIASADGKTDDIKFYGDSVNQRLRDKLVSGLEIRVKASPIQSGKLVALAVDLP